MALMPVQLTSESDDMLRRWKSEYIPIGTSTYVMGLRGFASIYTRQTPSRRGEDPSIEYNIISQE
jgi:hypothetical protein